MLTDLLENIRLTAACVLDFKELLSAPDGPYKHFKRPMPITDEQTRRLREFVASGVQDANPVRKLLFESQIQLLNERQQEIKEKELSLQRRQKELDKRKRQLNKRKASPEDDDQASTSKRLKLQESPVRKI